MWCHCKPHVDFSQPTHRVTRVERWRIHRWKHVKNTTVTTTPLLHPRSWAIIAKWQFSHAAPSLIMTHCGTSRHFTGFDGFRWSCYCSSSYSCACRPFVLLQTSFFSTDHSVCGYCFCCCFCSYYYPWFFVLTWLEPSSCCFREQVWLTRFTAGLLLSLLLLSFLLVNVFLFIFSCRFACLQVGRKGRDGCKLTDYNNILYSHSDSSATGLIIIERDIEDDIIEGKKNILLERLGVKNENLLFKYSSGCANFFIHSGHISPVTLSSSYSSSWLQRDNDDDGLVSSGENLQGYKMSVLAPKRRQVDPPSAYLPPLSDDSDHVPKRSWDLAKKR